MEHIQRAIALAGRLPPLLSDLGITQLRGGQIEASISSFSEAISKQPDFADAHFHLATAMLLQGDYVRGLPEYQWRRGGRRRPRVASYAISQGEPLAGRIPRWSGQALAGKRVLLCSEQGLGDVIMFMGLLPEFLKEPAGCGLVTTQRMKPFIDRDFPTIVGIYDEDALKPECQHYDYQLPLGDLMSRVLAALCSFSPSALSDCRPE